MRLKQHLIKYLRLLLHKLEPVQVEVKEPYKQIHRQFRNKVRNRTDLYLPEVKALGWMDSLTTWHNAYEPIILSQAQKEEEQPTRKYSGVYFLLDPVSGLTKIGHSTAIQKRFEGARTFTPYGFLLVGYISISEKSQKQAEDALHKIFDRYRVVNEFFDIPIFLLKDFVENCCMEGFKPGTAVCQAILRDLEKKHLIDFESPMMNRELSVKV